jgi:hypothetical protein
MLMMSMVDILVKANAFGDHVQDLVVRRGECAQDERNTLLMAYWSLAFEFHRGIICLLSHKFPGAAFSLARPLLEATVRAHVVLMGSLDDLEKLRNDQYRTNFASIGPEIDKAFGLGNVFEKLLGGARVALHGYTHVGLHQLGRRFSGDDLVLNYSEAEIYELFRVSTSAIFTVNALVTKRLGFEEEWKKNTDLYIQWGAADVE